MNNRMELHRGLCSICSHVYFQPPESVKLVYPCIVYSRTNIDYKYADDNTYNHRVGYQIIVIDKDPDSTLVSQLIKKYPMTKFDRHYASDNLNHDSFTIYY